jgi:hypothetical protein
MERRLGLFSDFPYEVLATLHGGSEQLNMAAVLLRLSKLLGESVWEVHVTKGSYFY